MVQLVHEDVCDRIIEEPEGGAHIDAEQTAQNISEYLTEAVARLKEIPTEELLEKRYEKFRKIGVFSEN